MKNITFLVLWGFAAAVGGALFAAAIMQRDGIIPTKYETGEIIKHKGRVFMLIEMQTEYRPLIPEEVNQ